MTNITIEIPIKIVSVANLREHWRKRAARTQTHRATTLTTLRAEIGYKRPELPVTVTLTRVAPRELDSDNLQSGFKAIRDGIADYFGVDDKTPLIEWKYAQRRGRPKEYTAIVTVDGEKP